MKLYLSAEERELLRSGARAVGMTVAGFAARAALDAALVRAAPVGARDTLEALAGVQLELLSIRRQLVLLRSELAQTRPGNTDEHSDHDLGPELERRCTEAVERLLQASRVLHQRLGR